MGVRVNRPGLSTTVQDGGRWGYQHRGVSVAGAMDPVSYRLANRLVGNEEGSAVLEVTLAGPVLTFDTPTAFAVTGADFELRLDDAPVPGHARRLAPAGGRLTFGRRRAGARAYLAVRGGFDVAPVLGSRSTHLASGIGGLEGRALVAGDRLETGVARGPGTSVAADTAPLVDLPDGGARVRVVAGPHHDLLEDAARRALRHARFTVSAQADRMGYRLEGERLAVRDAGSLVSSAVVAGAIQVPPDGQPIVLMADRQTVGGYPHVATIITADLPVVGQLSSADWIAFDVCGQETAFRARLRQERRLLAAGDPRTVGVGPW